MNILALYFSGSDLCRSFHVATSLSRENPQISIAIPHAYIKIQLFIENAYLLKQWMDLMYLSTLDLPGSLISESRTFVSSSSQVSMALPTYTHPVHNQPTYVCTLYTNSPRTIHTLYTNNSCMHKKMGFSVNPRISPSNLHATLDVRHFKCIHKYLQEALHNKIDIQY
jgi:hypothetical protein